MDDLGVPEMVKFGTCFCYKGKGGVVGCDATSLHVAKEKKGVLGMALIHKVSDFGAPRDKPP